MRGLRLFVRPVEASDAADLTGFLAAEGFPAASAPATGLLAKMLGRIVALVAFENAADGLRVDRIVVAKELRRRRIGRHMIGQLRDFAGKMEVHLIHVPRNAAAEAAADFLRGTGFVPEEDRWVLPV